MSESLASFIIIALGIIILGSCLILGVTTIRIMWNSSNGKNVESKEVKLASISFAVPCALIIFISFFSVTYEKSMSANLLSLIISIVVGVILKIGYQKLMELTITVYTARYNARPDDLK